jgi:hypothetical protein
MTESRHNCLAKEHYPKQIPNRWTDEKGNPTELHLILITYMVFSFIPILLIGSVLYFYADYMIGLNAEEFIEQKHQLISSIREMSCEEQAMKIIGKEYSTNGIVSDSHYANQEYKYNCLGVERPPEPEPPEVNHDPRVGRK